MNRHTRMNVAITTIHGRVIPALARLRPSIAEIMEIAGVNAPSPIINPAAGVSLVNCKKLIELM